MTVNPVLPVSVTIEATATEICEGTQVTFTATPVNGGQNPHYQWKINGNDTGSDNPVLTITSLVNNDNIQCILTSDALCANGSPATSNNIAMTVNQILPVSVTIEATATEICEGTQVTFTATPVNGGQNPHYQWKINGNDTGSDNPVLTITSLVNNDNIQCILTSDALCVTGSPANSNTIVMTVNPLPSPNISGDASVCTSHTAIYSTPYVSGQWHQYSWLISGGGTILSGQDTHEITVLWETAGNYELQVIETITSTSCVDSSSKFNVFVKQTPVPAFSSGSAYICKNITERYTTQPSMSDYQWTVSGSPGTDYIIHGGGDTNEYIDIEWLTIGQKTISVIYSNGSGCEPAEPAVLNVTVKAPPVAGTINGPNVVCEFDSVRYYIDGSDAINYYWTTPPGALGFSNTTDIGVKYAYLSMSGPLTVKGENECGMGEESILPVTVKDAVIPRIIAKWNNILICYNVGDSLKEYQWIRNGYNIQGATRQFYVTNRQPGNYNVITYDKEGCRNISNMITITPSTFCSFNPNPAGNQVQFTVCNEINGQVEILFSNLTGRSIKTISFEKTEAYASFNLDVNTFDQGVYMAEILLNGQRIELTKLVIIK